MVSCQLILGQRISWTYFTWLPYFLHSFRAMLRLFPGKGEKTLQTWRRAFMTMPPSNTTNGWRSTWRSWDRIILQKGDYGHTSIEFQMALKICLKVLGKDYPDTSAFHHNVGAVHYKRGDCDNALISMGHWRSTQRYWDRIIPTLWSSKIGSTLL